MIVKLGLAAIIISFFLGSLLAALAEHWGLI